MSIKVMDTFLEEIKVEVAYTIEVGIDLKIAIEVVS